MNNKRRRQTISSTSREADPAIIGSQSTFTPVTTSWSPRIRIVVSLLVCLHLLAVLAEPLRFFSRSPDKFAAEDTGALRYLLGPYVDFMYLSHGYFFFAPNPGPAHLIECEIIPESSPGNRATAESSSGETSTPTARSTSKWQMYPDRKDQWPRLLYHRHFMMSEFYHTLFAPTELENEKNIDPAMVEQWREDRRVYEGLQTSIKQNLVNKNPGHTVELKRIQHELALPKSILVDRWKLTDPRLFNELLEGPAKQPANTDLPKASLSPQAEAVPRQPLVPLPQSPISETTIPESITPEAITPKAEVSR